MTLRDTPPVSRFYEICLLQLGHFHVAGWILNYWPTWRSSRLASRVGRNDKIGGIMVQRVFIPCNFWARYVYEMEKHWVKTQKNIRPVKKASPSNWSIITIFEKENLVLEGHKGFPPHPASSHSLIKYWNTAPARKQNSIELNNKYN